MFVDEVKIHARAGRGGRGCVAFLREAFRPKGGPIGGDGGRGGHIILRADHDVSDLTDLYFAPRLKAEDGGHGLGKGMNGKAGRDLVVRVPCGTLVWRLPEPVAPAESQTAPGERVIQAAGAGQALEVDLAAAEEPAPAPQPSEDEPARARHELVADLTEHGQEVILCRGGRGGLGNRHFATARHQAPRFAQPGEPGEEGRFLLELRLIADIGLVGYPNAGKSTLLRAVSRAQPKVADYPFTTLHPHVGVVERPDWRRLTVCDIPGLIEGAHDNVGLGHAFLRHIRRCKALAIVLDMAGCDGREPWDDYANLLRELELYDPDLVARPRVVLANKMDEPAAAENLAEFRRRHPEVEPLPVAVAFDEGLEAMLAAFDRLVFGSETAA
ncbi:MAG: GTPase ObgE [Verrucomicrobia bacterium]|nr:MAG: GTPase ObgE [Verrucomicrobiota bacterium]